MTASDNQPFGNTVVSIPVQHIKIIRKGFGACEDTWMDEHLVIFSGNTISIDGDQTDDNLNDLTWWSHKHVNYATREAVNTLLMEYNLKDQKEEVQPKFFGTDTERKRWLKVKYAKTPLFVRPFINFFIRYILKAGFLECFCASVVSHQYYTGQTYLLWSIQIFFNIFTSILFFFPKFYILFHNFQHNS